MTDDENDFVCAVVICAVFQESRSRCLQESRIYVRRALHTPLVKHSSSFIPVKVLPSPLGAMVLYCYHTATYYSANLYRVVDLIKTDLYVKTRHFILLPLVSPRDSFPIHYRSHSDNIFMLQYRC